MALCPGCAIHTTSPTLLERLRDAPDEKTWHWLIRLYTPLLFYWARRSGESEHDAADLVQEVFVALVQTVPTFDYNRNGKFRSWLRTLTLNKLRDRKRRQAREEKALAQRETPPDAPDIAEAFWETEYQKELTRRALELMQAEFAPATWKACWETVVEGRTEAEVALELGIT